MDIKEYNAKKQALTLLINMRFDDVMDSIGPITNCKNSCDSKLNKITELERCIALTEKAIAEYGYTIALQDKLKSDWLKDPNNPCKLSEMPTGGNNIHG